MYARSCGVRPGRRMLRASSLWKHRCVLVTSQFDLCDTKTRLVRVDLELCLCEAHDYLLGSSNECFW